MSIFIVSKLAGQPMAFINILSKRPPKIRLRYVAALLLIPVLVWHIALPQVNVKYSEHGKNKIGYIWNVEHRIFKGYLFPGEVTGDSGRIFSNVNFFMYFNWNINGYGSCIQIKPKWPSLNIYIRGDGLLDESKTDMEYVKLVRNCVSPELAINMAY